MSYLPLLLSLASFGRHLPPRAPDRRGGPSGKVGTIPGAYTSPTWRPGDTTHRVCPACDPDDEPGGENVHPAPIATKRRSLAWAQRDAINQAKQRREAPSRAEFAAWMRGVVGERGKS